MSYPTLSFFCLIHLEYYSSSVDRGDIYSQFQMQYSL